MYYRVTRCIMWEAEPRVYWRVKRNGVWTYVAAYAIHVPNEDEPFLWIVHPPAVIESE